MTILGGILTRPAEKAAHHCIYTQNLGISERFCEEESVDIKQNRVLNIHTLTLDFSSVL